MIDKIKNKIVELWYKIPRYKLKIKLIKVRIDQRSYEWYLCRQKHGFDERELWNLSPDFDTKIRESLKLPVMTNLVGK